MNDSSYVCMNVPRTAYSIGCTLLDPVPVEWNRFLPVNTYHRVRDPNPIGRSSSFTTSHHGLEVWGVGAGWVP